MAGVARFLLAIPAYNEGQRLGPYLDQLLPALGQAALGVDVLVVDDGSRPEEAGAMRRAVDGMRERHPFLRPMLRVEPNQGKGGAVYAAWRQEREASWLAFVDADGAIPPAEVVRLVRLVADSGDPGLCAMAARVKMLGRDVRRHLHRHLIGRVFATLVHLLTGTGAYDTQCGFKIVPR